ncbi:MAG: hypothetical protein HC810_05815 [Acaryochloridaceae cyanobacterium RL_2_7]|nr:hypothetical protein [Acaryochloridaceae cyanobacterium RL_2_7]
MDKGRSDQLRGMNISDLLTSLDKLSGKDKSCRYELKNLIDGARMVA